MLIFERTDKSSPKRQIHVVVLSTLKKKKWGKINTLHIFTRVMSTGVAQDCLLSLTLTNKGKPHLIFM